MRNSIFVSYNYKNNSGLSLFVAENLSRVTGNSDSQNGLLKKLRKESNSVLVC